ncbi:ARL14 effector protein-like [Dreissena polymorpha]|nr:ARL14 effector protein-like [Dreissena polymorpha]
MRAVTRKPTKMSTHKSSASGDDADDVMIIDDDSDDDNTVSNYLSNVKSLNAMKAHRDSQNARVLAELDKINKLDISDEEKTKQAKQLRMLNFVNPGKFMDDFDPERSARELKKMNRRLNKDKTAKKNQMYNDKGLLVANGRDLCDCLEVDCIGCHFPCPKCKSEKCGGDCRCNRKWVYEKVESEGTGTTFNWPPEAMT